MDAIAAWRARLGASTIDWAVVVVLVLLTLLVAGVLDMLARGSTSPFEGDAGHEVGNRPLFVLARLLFVVPVFGYFAVFRRTGETPGMDIAGIQLVTSDGRSPGTARAVGRTILTVAFSASAYLAWLDAFGEAEPPPTRPYRELYADPPAAVGFAARIVLVVWLVGLFAALVDARRRTLWDRLFGLVHVEGGQATARDLRFTEWLRRRGG